MLTRTTSHSTNRQSHTHDGREEDKNEILALLKFVRRPMQAKEIADANDITFKRTRQLLDELIESRDIRKQTVGIYLVYALE